MTDRVELTAEGSDRGGLDLLFERMIGGSGMYAVVGILTPEDFRCHFRTGDRTVIARWTAIEPILASADIPTAELLIERAYRRRVGKDPDQLNLWPESLTTNLTP
jgi:hypothetical protein